MASVQFHLPWGSPLLFPVVLQLTRAWRGRASASGESPEQEDKNSGREDLPATPQDWEGESLFPLLLVNNSSPIKPWSLFSRLSFSGFTITSKGIFIKFFSLCFCSPPPDGERKDLSNQCKAPEGVCQWVVPVHVLAWLLSFLLFCSVAHCSSHTPVISWNDKLTHLPPSTLRPYFL